MARNPFVTLDPDYPIVPCAERPTEPAMPPTRWPEPRAPVDQLTGQPIAAPRELPTEVGFLVIGTPKPKGSKDYRGKRRNGSAILVESAEVGPWQAEVARAARATGVTFAGPVEVHTEFRLRRPKKINDAVTGLGRNAGDGDKLTRAVWDALTEAGVISDDSRVLRWSGSKRLAEPDEPTGVRVTVREYR
jgi:Holliday junction resolvase RusA-like endonuclease